MMARKNEDRQLKTPEDMLALAEELAARHPAQILRERGHRPPSAWLARGLWFLGGAGAASLLWWLSLL